MSCLSSGVNPYLFFSPALTEKMHVSLAEALEVRGGPLQEEEVWAVLSQSADSLQELFHKGTGTWWEHWAKTDRFCVVIFQKNAIKSVQKYRQTPLNETAKVHCFSYILPVLVSLRHEFLPNSFWYPAVEGALFRFSLFFLSLFFACERASMPLKQQER